MFLREYLVCADQGIKLLPTGVVNNGIVIISLLNFVLSNNYFVYNDTIYKQIHGCAMGNPTAL